MFILNNLFKEQGKVDHDEIINLDGSIVDEQVCGVPFSKECKGLMYLYKLATQMGPKESYVGGAMPQVSSTKGDSSSKPPQ